MKFSPAATARSAGRDDGSAAVEFVLVAPLLLLLLLAVVQVALAMHVRSTLTSAAAEGARAAALAGADPLAGVARTHRLLENSVAASVVQDVTAVSGSAGSVDVMIVRVDAVLPLVGLLGPQSLTVEGRAIREGWT